MTGYSTSTVLNSPLDADRPSPPSESWALTAPTPSLSLYPPTHPPPPMQILTCLGAGSFFGHKVSEPQTLPYLSRFRVWMNSGGCRWITLGAVSLIALGGNSVYPLAARPISSLPHTFPLTPLRSSPILNTPPPPCSWLPSSTLPTYPRWWRPSTPWWGWQQVRGGDRRGGGQVRGGEGKRGWVVRTSPALYVHLADVPNDVLV